MCIRDSLKTAWVTNATTGYLVQEIDGQMTATDAAGRPVPIDVPHYWEAWRINGPNRFDPSPFDHWTIHFRTGTRGTWRKA